MNQTFLIQKLTWVIAALFLIVIIIGNIPIFNGAKGSNFGLFNIDLIESAIYFLTAIMGAIAAYSSAPFSRWFLVTFGLLYGFNAFVGLTMSRGLLDFSIFMQGLGSPDFSRPNITVNAPHAIIALIMIVIGVSGKVKNKVPVGFENI